MNQTPHTPDLLADELDRLLPDQAAASDDPLIAAAARVSAAPRPALSPEARVRIRATILAVQAAPSRSPLRRFRRQSMPVRLALVAALLILIAGTVWASQRVIPLFTPSGATALPPTALPTLTLIPVSAPPSIQPTEAVTPEPAPPVSIIVEGPVQSIAGSTVVIFDLKINLSSTDPLLSTIQIGDVLRVEGAVAADPTVITAVQTTLVNVEVEANPADSQQIWRDFGDCSHPPPSWATANGWRRRCQGATNPGNSGGQGMGMGKGD